MTAINPKAIRGPVTAVPVVAGKGVRFVEDTENNRIVAEADETVLMDTATLVSNGLAISLSEDYSHFERIKIFAARNPSGAGVSPQVNEFEVSNTYTKIRFLTMNYNDSTNNVMLDCFTGYFAANKLNIARQCRKDLGNTAITTTTDAPVTITKIVGINRVASA